MEPRDPFHPYILLIISIVMGLPSVKLKTSRITPSDRFQRHAAANPRKSRYSPAIRGWNAAKPVPPPVFIGDLQLQARTEARMDAQTSCLRVWQCSTAGQWYVP